MSEATDTAEARARAKGQPQTPAAMPQWGFELARPPVRFLLTRLLWRVSYSGFGNVPARGGLVIAANHQTYVDPFWVGLPFKRPVRYLAWNEAFGWPLAGKLIELLGAWPLDVEKSDPAAYRRSLQWLRHGRVIVIFPEGGRAPADGAMSRFKQGAARLALEAGVPILPVTIRGGHRVWPREQRWPRTGRVEIVYHPLQHLTVRPGEDSRQSARRETEKLAATIQSAL